MRIGQYSIGYIGYAPSGYRQNTLDFLHGTGFQHSHHNYMLVCLYISKILKRPLKDFRICKPQIIAIWIACSVILPLAISAFYIFFTPGNFSVSDLETTRKVSIILSAVLRSGLVAGITEELLFRGLIMRVPEIRWNKDIAIVVPSILFALLHIFSMENFNFGLSRDRRQ